MEGLLPRGGRRILVLEGVSSKTAQSGEAPQGRGLEGLPVGASPGPLGDLRDGREPITAMALALWS